MNSDSAIKKIIPLFILLSILLSFTACADERAHIESSVRSLNSYGEIVIDCTSKEFIEAGFQVGDLAEV